MTDSTQSPALEVLPPANPNDLPSIEAQIRDLQFSLNEKQRNFFNEAVYDVVALGLFFLKAENIHLLKVLPATVAGRSRKTNAKGQLQAGEGFTQWLFDTFPDISERTARNYRNAARNCGLTSDHTLADVQALREKLALHEKKPTDLYRLVDKEAETPPNATGPAVSVAQATAKDLFTWMDNTLSLKEEMEPETYEAVWQRGKDWLEALTGVKWVMAEDASPKDQKVLRGGAEGKGKKKGLAAENIKRWKKQKGGK